MSQMLPDGAEVMRRVACGDVCPAAPPTHNRISENKELLRQQLLSSKERPPSRPRTRHKNRWKLKFHHQALPQEYLDHYEQSLQRASAKQRPSKPDKPKQEPPAEVDALTSETFKIWAQRLAGIHPEGDPPKPRVDDRRKKPPAIAPSKVLTYDDLPYMGEMTLNNSKPRRGRKPKKADICHLIYENYGTVVPGQPQDNPQHTPKSDLQHKIISNLLERKLSQESKRRVESSVPAGLARLARLASPDAPRPAAPPTLAGPLHSDDEPLNLCIRDLHDLKIQIQKKFGNIYGSLPDLKTEAEELDEMKTEQPNAISVIQRNTSVVPSTARSSPDLSRVRVASPTLSEPAPCGDRDDRFHNYVFVPHAGLYMHPLALQTQLLYYQRLAAAGQLPINSDDKNDSTLTCEKDGGSSPQLDESKNKLVLKQISELLDPKVIKQVEEAKRSPDQSKMKRSSPNPVQGPVKRKRSAIFIPPVPTKTNSSTPTTEVSICKFKFTGGSKPSLQEKKMLSVDSGGNFRYYSGTGGAKGNKGYEYLHRDSVQGRSESGESSTSVPKIEEHGAQNKEDLTKKKRKSRKSLQREKLEQTFKEKGFLIQTQQLQSAEGATYCKFRQLRKFTRYLFRSWKDYLPGELDERTNEATNSGESNKDVTPNVDPSTSGEWG